MLLAIKRLMAGARQEGGISSITVKCKISESVGREVTGWGPAIKRLMTGERRELSTTVKHQTAGERQEGSCRFCCLRRTAWWPEKVVVNYGKT